MLKQQEEEEQRLEQARLAKEDEERIQVVENRRKRKAEEEQRQRQLEQDEEEAKEDRATLVGEGLPTSFLMRKKGYLLSNPASLSNKLAKLFEVRLELCRNVNLRNDAVLPVSLQMQGQRMLPWRWSESIAGQKKQRLVTRAPHK